MGEAALGAPTYRPRSIEVGHNPGNADSTPLMLCGHGLRVAVPQRSGRIFLAGEMTGCCGAEYR
jgi:hypothetical protein